MHVFGVMYLPAPGFLGRLWMLNHPHSSDSTSNHLLVQPPKSLDCTASPLASSTMQ